jgi:hypothetical protein
LVRGLSQASGAQPVDIALADFDNDARTDAVTANFTGNNVSIFLGTGILTGTGAFQAGVSANVVTAPQSVTTADFDNDGDVDIAAANGTGSLSLLLGNGDGTMQPHIDLTIPASTSTHIVAADIDADGNADIVVATGTGITVLFGAGDGTFARQQAFTLTHSVGALSVVDVNHDGLLDVVAAQTSAAGPLTVMVNVSQ